MATNTPGRGAIAIAIVSALTATPTSWSRPAQYVVQRGTADFLSPGDVVRASGPGTMATRVETRATLDAEGARFVNDGAGTRNARAYGVFVNDGGSLSLAGSQVGVSGPWGIGIQVQGKATLDLGDTLVEVPGEAGIGVLVHRGSLASLDDVRIVTHGRHGVGLFVAGGSQVTAEGAHIAAAATGATALGVNHGEARLRGSTLEAPGGNAVSTRFQGDGTARVRLDDSTVLGRIESGTPGLSIHARGTRIDGDAVRTGKGELEMRLANGAWRGRGSRLTSLHLDHSVWTVTGDSDVGSVRLAAGGRIDVDRAQAGFRSVRVGSWHADPDASGIVLGARLDAGGSLRRQATDRLLVSGDATGLTPLHVANVGGGGAATTERGGPSGPGDGISVVQVAGASMSDAFQLAGDYVAVGPWQYRLQAYEPGRSDPDQRLVAGEGGYWDFRLQSTRAGEATSRTALVPQVPAYLVLAHALFGYGRGAIDALRPVGVSFSRGPAVRVLAFGGDAGYRSSLSRASYGIDYRRSDRGLQVAGDVLVQAIGDTTLRTGVALSVGSARISPRADDGDSAARATAHGIAWHASWTTQSGWAVTSAYGVTRYRIDVRTPTRGEVLPRLRAKGSEATVSAAFRWRPSARLLVEPGVSVLWQRLRFARGRDGDGIDVVGGSPRRTTLRGGAKASLVFQPEGRRLYAWSPYIDLRYAVARDSGTSLQVSGERLPSARAGRSIDVAAGATFEFGTRWTVCVDTTARLARGRGSESGRGARAGAVWSF
ncbi:autotransporter outer membrane beta-barrel domain-containing protein [Luteibacter sp. NPDC031894]|uniref:autotransporter outer membrane beta-barrel domain-containing protein n=1 Tax=Luteibacter sp. NPDC031894 TaxID=3390572 RepID=UPI003CFDA5B2